MNQDIDTESGFLADPEREFRIETGFSDVEVIRVSSTNVIARGKRYGRYWLLKALRPDVADNATYRRRMQKEFEIHTRLHSSAVAGAVSIEAVPKLGECMVIEWVEGTPLNTLLQEGSLSKQERGRIMRGLIAAVSYLHSRGVIHRDLKPSNIMIRKNGGEPVIIDFGLADTGDYAELKNPAGTAGFISPEQVASRPPAPTDDIYSLGVIMERLTPQYRRIARRCSAPLHRRPKNAADLLRLLNRHDRKPKIIGIALISLILLTIAAAAINRIQHLSRSSAEAKEAIASVNQSAEESNKEIRKLTVENQRHQNHVTRLTDSLRLMTDRVHAAEENLKAKEEYEKLCQALYREGCRKIDLLLADFDKEIYSGENGINFADMNAKMPELHKKAAEIYKNISDRANSPSNSSSHPSVSPSDCEKIGLEVYNYYLNKFSTYQKKWLQQTYPTKE